jgi:PIN domain nuclease of toxin-antitoxin system
VEAALRQAAISSVNLAEVVTKLIHRGASIAAAEEAVDRLGCEVADVGKALGLRAGALYATTKPYGLSLGDRVCIALAEREGLPVMTADRGWLNAPLGVEVTLIR